MLSQGMEKKEIIKAIDIIHARFVNNLTLMNLYVFMKYE